MADKTLLVSDVDGTLLGDDGALGRFAEWCDSRRDELVLAYASGRFCESLQESVRSTRLPAPDYLIGGVGTQMQHFVGGTRLVEWEESPLERWDPPRIRAALKGVPHLEPQPIEFQSHRKISYFLCGASPTDLARVRELLLDAGLRVDL